MINLDEVLSSLIVLWAVIDPVGTIPVFIATTKGYSEDERKKIAKISSLVAFIVLLFFLLIGEILLRRVGVSLAAFQISGGVILFLFALNMIFGDSKPEEELQLIKTSNETAIFPLAMPSIAGPGAILAIVLLNNSGPKTYKSTLLIAFEVLIILAVNYLFMRLSSRIQKRIGNSGAIVISKVMGLILASMAASNILLGIRTFFNL